MLAFRNVTNASQRPGWSGLSEARRDGVSWLASAKYVFGETDVHYLLNTAVCGTCVVWGSVRKCHSNGRTGFLLKRQ